MKKITVIYCAIMMLAFNVKASDDLFSYDAAKMEAEFAALTQIEELVLANPEASAAEINTKIVQSELIADISLYQNSSMFASMDGGFTFDDMDWGSFAWGFCCCYIGFFVVGINNNKTQDQRTSFWIGVGVNVVLGIISNAAYYASGGY